LLALLLVICGQVIISVGAFIIPTSIVPVRNPTSTHRTLLPGPSSSWIASENGGGDSVMEVGAFQDSIVLMDDTIQTMLIVFAVFIGLALVFSSLRGQVDQAIQIIVRDFAATVEQYYPTRWKSLQENELLGLTEDERDVKLLAIMEKWEKEDPKFMSEIRQRMKK
jgi:hypothetical protein